MDPTTESLRLAALRDEAATEIRNALRRNLDVIWIEGFAVQTSRTAEAVREQADFSELVGRMHDLSMSAAAHGQSASMIGVLFREFVEAAVLAYAERVAEARLEGVRVLFSTRPMAQEAA